MHSCLVPLLKTEPTAQCLMPSSSASQDVLPPYSTNIRRKTVSKGWKFSHFFCRQHPCLGAVEQSQPHRYGVHLFFDRYPRVPYTYTLSCWMPVKPSIEAKTLFKQLSLFTSPDSSPSWTSFGSLPVRHSALWMYKSIQKYYWNRSDNPGFSFSSIALPAYS